MLIASLIVIAIGVENLAADRDAWGLFGVIGGLALAEVAGTTRRRGSRAGR